MNVFVPATYTKFMCNSDKWKLVLCVTHFINFDVTFNQEIHLKINCLKKVEMSFLIAFTQCAQDHITCRIIVLLFLVVFCSRAEMRKINLNFVQNK